MVEYRRKLIEVALPLEAINREAAREKSIRHGHPSTLHLWWARRPLAACRAVLFASLVDDPDSDPRFDAYGPEEREHAVGERRAELFDLIEELVKWENSNNPTIINRARAEIASSVASRKIELGEFEKDTIVYAPEGGKLKEGDKHPDGSLAKDGTTAYRVLLRQSKPDVVNHFLANYAPPVLDPFAGGGSIPLEAQRLGLRAYASDLNPVAVLINKALIEIPHKFQGTPPVHPKDDEIDRMIHKKSKGQSKFEGQWYGIQGLAEDVRYYGTWMRREAEKRIGHLYPKVAISDEIAKDSPELRPYIGRELTVIAWLWARTIDSPDPATHGAPVPLVKSFWLSKRKGRKSWIEPVTRKDSWKVSFGVRRSEGEPRLAGTVTRGGGKCVLTGTPIPFDYIRAAGKEGRLGITMMAIAAQGDRERVYLPACAKHQEVALAAQPSWAPDAQLPHNPFSLRPPLYGLYSFSDLFTARQLTVLSLLSDLVLEVARQLNHSPERNDNRARPYDRAKAVSLYLALAISKLADLGNTGCLWEPVAQCPRNLFGRQALPMHWSFAEANPFSESSGSFAVVVDNLCRNLLASVPTVPTVASVRVSQADACKLKLSQPAPMVCTDPPYYNNVDYADLSDFFYVWLRRSLRDVFPDLLATVLTPKEPELVATPYRFGGDKVAAKDFFESGLAQCLQRIRAGQQEGCPFTLFYAFKQAEAGDNAGDTGVASTGWETMLQGVLSAGFAVTGTWPLRTELTSALKDNMNSLASSVLLVCRPRGSDAPMATRREFGEALRAELPAAIRKLQSGNVAPVDLAQASIGPGMAVFSRYSKVVNADGAPMSVREALQLINHMLDEALTEQEADFDADTRWALKWFEQYGEKEGVFGDAETLAKATAVSVGGLVEAGFLKSGSGKVRLLKREELDPTWDPVTDTRLTIWEITQYLILRLEQDGETGAAELLRSVGAGHGETARELAYRLYQTCERKKWADQARSYNGLVVSWPEIERLARERRREPAPAEATLFDNE